LSFYCIVIHDRISFIRPLNKISWYDLDYLQLQWYIFTDIPVGRYNSISDHCHLHLFTPVNIFLHQTAFSTHHLISRSEYLPDGERNVHGNKAVIQRIKIVWSAHHIEQIESFLFQVRMNVSQEAYWFRIGSVWKHTLAELTTQSATRRVSVACTLW
jgi:hypothetical protein